MDLVSRGAYRKRPLDEISSPDQLPVEFLLEWYKDTLDAPRTHTDEELIEMARLPPASRLAWLEEMAEFTWKARTGGSRPAPRASRAAERSRVAREEAELAMTPAERLTLALELSDLCEELAAAGRSVVKERE